MINYSSSKCKQKKRVLFNSQKGLKKMQVQGFYDGTIYGDAFALLIYLIGCLPKSLHSSQAFILKKPQKVMQAKCQGVVSFPTHFGNSCFDFLIKHYYIVSYTYDFEERRNIMIGLCFTIGILFQFSFCHNSQLQFPSMIIKDILLIKIMFYSPL